MRCLPFTHDWKPRCRAMTSAKRHELALTVMRTAILMPALLVTAQYEFDQIYSAKWLQVGRQCRRCGKRVGS